MVPKCAGLGTPLLYNEYVNMNMKVRGIFKGYMRPLLDYVCSKLLCKESSFTRYAVHIILIDHMLYYATNIAKSSFLCLFEGLAKLHLCV